MKLGSQQLLSGMKWCHYRKLFIDIQEGKYVPKMATHVMSEWANMITQIYRVEVCGASELLSLSFDGKVAELVMGDTISNAQKYGHPKRNPWVELVNDDGTLTIKVCNVANPTAPIITDEMATRMVQGGKGPSMGNGANDDLVLASDGIGLQNAAKALNSISGTLKMHQTVSLNDRVTVVSFKIPSQVVPVANEEPSASSINIVADNEKADAIVATAATGIEGEQCRPRSLQPESSGPKQGEGCHVPAATDSGGNQMGPPLYHAGTGKSEHRTQSKSVPAGLIGALVEDQALLRKMTARSLFKKGLCVSEVRTVGEGEDDIGAAVDIIMGRKTQNLEPVVDNVQPADIVTLDQDLGRGSDGKQLLGTDIAARLHAENFSGLVCMLTGASAEELAAYLQLPGVDCAVSKGTDMREVVETVSCGYWEKIHKT
jgi:hypothetical protein